MGRSLIVLATAALLAGCSSKPDPGKKTLGQQTADITEDTRTLEDATAAVNSVVRNSTDCEVVKAALPDANRRLDEAKGKLKTVAGMTSLDALRAQVKSVAQNCN